VAFDIVGTGLASHQDLSPKACALQHVWLSHLPFAGDAKTSCRFDVFKRNLSGHPIWLGVVEGLEEAEERMNRFAEDSPGPYFIYSEERGIVLNLPTRKTELTSSGLLEKRNGASVT
jgi:hypothetical protein